MKISSERFLDVDTYRKMSGMIALAAAILVPKIGTVYGLRVGVDTMEQLERKLGPGKQFTGGHPRGGRMWIESGREWVISADGFEYGNGGRLMEGIFLERRDASQACPKARPVKIGVLSNIRPNMSRQEVRKALGDLKGRWNGDVFTQAGKADVHHATNRYVDHLRRWQATFSFDDQGLGSVELHAE